MRSIAVVLCGLAVSACVTGKPCIGDGECSPGVCDQTIHICVTAPDAGVVVVDAGNDAGPPDAGRDAGTPDAGDAGLMMDGGADAGDSGVPDSGIPFCGLTCAEWEDCEANRDGGRCLSAGYEVTWLTPDAGVRSQGAVTGVVRVTRSDGGAVSVTDVPVRQTDGGAMRFAPQGADFGGFFATSGPDGVKQLIAGWEDGGPTAPLTLTKDTTAPTFTVALVNPPSYGNLAADFLPMDPDETGPLPMVKKDETLQVRVTSVDRDVARVAIAVHGGSALWDAGVGVACTTDGGFCRDYTLQLGVQPMQAFADVLRVQASGQDDLQNAATGSDDALAKVTRWKWARQVTVQSIFKASPAIGAGGVIYLAATGSSAGGGVFTVTPEGDATQWSTAKTEASMAIGRGVSRTEERAYFVPVSGALQTLDGGSCVAASTSNYSSIAILGDGTAASYGVAVTGETIFRQVRTLGAVSGCGPGSSVLTGVGSVDFPGNIVVSGSSLWYPANDGSIKRFSQSGPAVSELAEIASIGAGSIYGVSLFSAGATLAGGGGAGISRVFVRSSDGSGAVSGFNQSRYVSGVSVGSGPRLFAMTQDSSGGATLRRLDATGSETATLNSGAFMPTFPSAIAKQPGSTTPVLGSGDWVFAAGSNGTVLAANQSSMTLQWAKPMSSVVAGDLLASPTLDCNRTKPSSGTGVYYFVTSDGWLVAYITESPGLDDTAVWPKYQHDARNTGNLGVAIECP